MTNGEASEKIFELAAQVVDAAFEAARKEGINSRDVIMALAISCGMAIGRHKLPARADLTKMANGMVSKVVGKLGPQVN